MTLPDPGKQHHNDDEWTRIGSTDHRPYPDVVPDSPHDDIDDDDGPPRRFTMAERVLDEPADRWEQEWVDAVNSRHADDDLVVLDRIDLRGADKHRAIQEGGSPQ